MYKRQLLFLIIAVISLVVLIKLAVWVLRVGFFLLILPLKILVVLTAALLSVFVILPLGLLFGMITVALSPLLILIPFLPVLLIALGVWLIVRSH